MASGNYTLIAKLNGDDYYESSFNITTLEVKRIDNITMNINMPEVIKAREYFTITVELSQNATGIVFIDIDNLGYYGYIKNREASILIPGLDAGKHNITVRYSGDSQYDVKIEKLNCSVLKSSSAIEIYVNKIYNVGDDIIINLNPINSTGEVTATINGVYYPVVENNITIPNGLAEGTYKIVAKLAGDNNFNKSENTATFKVETKVIIIAPDVIKYYTNPERFIIVVTYKNGAVIPNKTVYVTINGVTYTKTTNEDGETSIGLNLNPGTYTVTTSCDNTKVNSTVKILKTVNGTDIVKVYKNSTQYYATFHDNNGNYLADGTTVTFNINGVFYERKISGDKGLARLNINLNPGEYILTAINPQTNEMSSNNITVLSRFSDYNDLVKYYKNDSQYTVKVIGDDGNPVGANETVTFNINGVFYKRMTNSEGIAKLNINLGPGEYVITAEYKDSMVSNNITVLSVLLTKDLQMYYHDGSKFEAKLLDGKGNPFPNQNVTFNINGVLYTRTTDSNGTAKLNINLDAGIYTITSSYNGYSVGNYIIINKRAIIPFDVA